MNANNRAGRAYLEKKIRDLARQANIPIDDDGISWYEPPDRDASDIMIKSRGKSKTVAIENIDLEDTQRRGTLDGMADQIVKSL